MTSPALPPISTVGATPIAGPTMAVGLSAVIDSVISARAIHGRSEDMVYMKGRVAIGDGGEGMFFWDPTLVAADDDGGTKLVPTTEPVDGGWQRLAKDFAWSVKWFGAKGDNATDDTAAIQAAYDAANAAGQRHLWAPAGTYLISNPALAAWQATHAYVVGNVITNASRTYVCITAGASAGAGGPTTTSGDITDGTVHWQYAGEGTKRAGVLQYNRAGIVMHGLKPNANAIGELAGGGGSPYKCGTVFRYYGNGDDQTLFDVMNCPGGGFEDVGFYGYDGNSGGLVRNAVRWRAFYGAARSSYGWHLKGCYDTTFNGIAYYVCGTDASLNGGTEQGYGDMSGLRFDGCTFGGTYAAGANHDTGAITINVTAATKTFHRTTGSWITDGFKVGMIAIFSGFTTNANNGAKVIKSLTASDLVVETAGLTDELGGGDERAITTTAHVGCTSGETLGIVIDGVVAYGDTVLNTPACMLLMTGGTATVIGGGGALWSTAAVVLRGQMGVDFPSVTFDGPEWQSYNRVLDADAYGAVLCLRDTVINGGFGDCINPAIQDEIIRWNVPKIGTGVAKLVFNGGNYVGDINIVAADAYVVANGLTLHQWTGGQHANRKSTFTGHTERVTGTWFEGAVARSSFLLEALPTYADNAAALVGTLVAGDLYKTSAGVVMVCLG
jgi:hypothetical protein